MLQQLISFQMDYVDGVKVKESVENSGREIVRNGYHQ